MIEIEDQKAVSKKKKKQLLEFLDAVDEIQKSGKQKRVCIWILYYYYFFVVILLHYDKINII